jgi:internalin A
MTSALITIEPIVSYPRTARPGERHCLTIDVRHHHPPEQWPYPGEELALTCFLETALFSHEPLGDQKIVLHRFGGSYGPAVFLLTAREKRQKGGITLNLVNRYGMPIHTVVLHDIEITETSPLIEAPRASVLVPSKVRPSDIPRSPEEFLGKSSLQNSGTSEVFRRVSPSSANLERTSKSSFQKPHLSRAPLGQLGSEEIFERNSKPLNEFKLVLIGRGGVGKTTLVHRLVTGNYKEFKRTPGINITQWPIIIGGHSGRAHIWDFGGQEIMHGTHRLFMTERALYLVLVSGREGTEDHDAEYWLSMVRSFAGNVPVIVLLHKWNDYRFELNRELLREKYGRDIVFIETDSSTAHGISILREQIRQLAARLPGTQAEWPSTWRRVKDELSQQKKNWMTFDDFLSFCHERGITNRNDKEALAESLHDLGLMLSYQKDEALRDFGVLNPRWVIQGIYNMLNATVLRYAGGKFNLETFGKVLSAKEYPKELHPYLLALMRKFQLCHPLDEKGENYLIPELLTKEEPKLDAEFPPDKCLGFIYRYDSVLPEGLLPRFIVETYVYREPKHAWRTGVVLERANCRALVRGDVQSKTITIRVAGFGNGRRELLGIIREHFERIHRSYEKLLVTELVPIPGYPETLLKHELLLKYERAGRSTILVDIGEDLREVSIKELLDGIDLPGVPRAQLQDSRSAVICYSRKDKVFLDQLRAALVPYERKGKLLVWTDEIVEPGQSQETEIHSHLERAQIIILLLSNDFLSSSHSVDKELQRAMERRAAGECEIMPVVVRASRYDKFEFGNIQAILPGGRPVNEHEQRDYAWLEVTRQLERVIEKLKRGKELRDFSVKGLLEGVDFPRGPRSRSAVICYARKDEIFLDQLRAALVPYERKGELTVWADKLIEPGQGWETEIHSHLEQAEIIILLLSSDFLSSSDSIDKELQRAMERRKAGECEIVPIVVRASRYDRLELGNIQAIMPSGKPINAHKDVDYAWLEVTQQLDRIIEKLKKN